jgi:hypothetical protein
MSLPITLTPQAEAELREGAARAGKDPATYAREALEEQLASAHDLRSEEAPVARDQRVSEFLKWVASHRPVGHAVDDSRESIYEGRGH